MEPPYAIVTPSISRIHVLKSCEFMCWRLTNLDSYVGVLRIYILASDAFCEFMCWRLTDSQLASDASYASTFIEDVSHANSSTSTTSKIWSESWIMEKKLWKTTSGRGQRYPSDWKGTHGCTHAGEQGVYILCHCWSSWSPSRRFNLWFCILHISVNFAILRRSVGVSSAHEYEES